MIRALVWKEVREQGVIVAALGVLGAAVLLAIGLWSGGDRGGIESRSALTDPGVLGLVMLVVTGGAVVGGTLFAAEKENGTDVFLALLPVRRRGVWAGKMAGGAGLVLAVTALFLVVAAPVGLLGQRYLAVGVVGLVALALATFAWGSVGSILTRSSLAAAGLGAVFLAVAAVLVLPVVIAVLVPGWTALSGNLSGITRGPSELVAVCGLLFTLLVLPVVISLRLYTRPDRDRHRRAVRGAPGAPIPRRSFRPFVWVGRLTAGFRAALWISLRQYRLPALLITGFGLVAGLCLLMPPVSFAAVWPAVGFLLAVLVGVLGWYDEQASGAKRFWVERRLPAGRMWLAKLLVGAAVSAGVTLAALLPVAVKAWVFHRDYLAAPSFLLGEPDFPLVTYLLLWPAYGFVFGHLTGIVFRKTVVAAAVAVMVGGVAAGVWLPSLFGGGLHWWQPWLPVAGAVLAARGLAWWFAADRVGSRVGLLRLAAGGFMVTSLCAIGLGYRVFEITIDPARGDEEAFERDQIPKFADNYAGQAIRTAGVQLQDGLIGRSAAQEQLARGNVPTPTLWAHDPFARLPQSLVRMLDTALEHGWQPTDEADRLLAVAFATKWDETLEAAHRMERATDFAAVVGGTAATHPRAALGTVEDPRDLKLNSPLRYLTSLDGADALLLVRGLKAQHDGDPERFVADFALVLNLSRNVRNKSVQACADAGRRMESLAVLALQRWLERLSEREDLLVQIEEELAYHDERCVDDRADVRLADQVVLRNTFSAPGEVLRRDWHHADVTDEAARARMDAEADLVGFAWQMPWEKERHERLIALGNGSGYGGYGLRTFQLRDRSPFRGLPAVDLWPHPQSAWTALGRGGFVDSEGLVQTDRRAARTLLAIRRYELKHHAPPPTLQALADEGFLPAVPTDPFANAPFGYRLSVGETLTAEYLSEPPLPFTLSDAELQLASVVGGVVLPVESRWRANTYSSVLSPTPSGTELGAVVGGLVGSNPLFAVTPRPGLVVVSQGGVTEVQIPVPAGRPVLWGVGTDRRDDNGMKFSTLRGRSRDQVYLPAPNPPKE